MRVKIQLWFLATLLTLTLAGCGGGSLSSSSTPENPTPAPPPAAASLTAITVTPGSQTIAAGSQQQFKATGSYSDKSSKDLTSSVTWKSSSANVATINSSGLATVLAAGQTTISATVKSIDGSAGLTATDNLVSVAIKASGSNVNVGSELQLTAMGTFQDGKPATPLANVAWTSSAPSYATISNLGLVSGIHGGEITVTAKSGSISANMQFSVTALLKSITLSPVGAAVLVGGHQQFSAIGAFNDGTVQNLTASASWSSSDQTKVTIVNGLANGVAVGAANLTVSQSGVNSVTALNVVSSAYPPLSGNYAFTLSATDSRGPASYAGSINFNGNGGITGIEDSNNVSGVNQQVPITGSYLLYPDGRGNITFNANASHPAGITLRLFLASSGATGSLIQFDGLATARGILTQQNPAAFNAAAINGTYVFQGAGVDTRINSPNGPAGITEIGIFAADGAGNIAGGVDDINDYGVVNGLNPLSASTYSVDANGRGTFQFTDASGTTNYSLYVVDSTKLYFLQTDPDPATALLGLVELQTPQSYATASGNFAYFIGQPVIVEPNSPQIVVTEGQLGDLALAAPSILSGVLNNDTINGTFINNYGAINGRGQITTCGSGQPCTQSSDQHTYFYYMVSPSEILIMQVFTYSNYPQFRPAVGQAILEAQTPYSVSSLQGSYVMQAHDGNSYADALMLLTFDGAGNVSGIVDQDQVGGVSSTVIGAPQFVLTPTPTGDTVLQLSTPGGTENYYIYLFSNSGGFLGGVTTPLGGSLTQQ
ncbi:MAG: Ig-like domain-containing protein [Terriglobales bacterium]